MTQSLKSSEELIQTLKTFENSETKEVYVDEIIDYLEAHGHKFDTGKEMLRFFKNTQDRLLTHFRQSTQPITYKDELPNGRTTRIVGIRDRF